MSIQNSHQISDVKILLKQGATGASIVSITKTGTSGLVDTYTVATSDGGRYTFEVTNGSDIQSIEKTSSHGEVDTYTVTLTNGNTTTFEVTNGDNWIDNSEKTATDAFQTITGGLLKECKVALSPVQSGSGDPSPSNVRPITGHTQVKVERCGKNLINPTDVTSGTKYAFNIVTQIYELLNGGVDVVLRYFFKANVAYTLSATMINGNIKPCIIVRNIDGSQTGQKTNYSNVSQALRFSFDTDGERDIYLQSNGQGTNQTVGSTFTLMLEASANETEYEPYIGETYTVEIPSGTGTVYGGTLDLVSGQLVIDKVLQAITVYDSGTSTSGTKYADCAFAGQTDTPAISNMYKQIASTSAGYNGSFKVYSVALTFYDDRFTSVEVAQGILNNCQVVIDLVTPTVIQLTPTQVETLIGDNNLLCPLAGQAMVEDGVKYFYIYTYHDLMDAMQIVADPIEDRVDDIETELAKVTWSSAVSCAVGATSCTIADANIATTSVVEVFASNSSGNTSGIKNISVTTGQAVLTFNSLLEATSFKLRITN